MSKKKPSATPADDKPQQIHYRPTREVADALLDFRSQMEFDPGPGPIVERAMRAFLRSKGYPIPEREPGERD